MSAVLKNVILVDPDDKVIGVSEKIKAHRFGMLHRAFSIFIFRQHNNQIELLLQQRAFDKYHSAGLWTNTCCGHPEPHENTLVAARLRLNEEMGINTSLQEIGLFHYIAPFSNGLIENEIDHVIVGVYDGELLVNPSEVAAYNWIDLIKLQQDLALDPLKYTVWFSKALQIILQQQITLFNTLFKSKSL